VHGARILALGAAYKPGTSDARQSPAVEVTERLRQMGADVTVVDPYLPDGGSRTIPFAAEAEDVGTGTCVADFDAVVLLTPHGEFDLERLAAEAAFVLDTRGVMTAASHIERL
jgi:UDP-N-acetyl-D-glucosamine dehydrogenase